jgi:hypothetical protein
MSNDASSWAWRLDLPPTEKVVIASMADRANASGYCWSSCRDTMARTGLSERAVQKAAARLAERGYLIIETRTARNGRTLSNMYRVQYVEKWNDAPPPQRDQIDDGYDDLDAPQRDEPTPHPVRPPPAPRAETAPIVTAPHPVPPAPPFLNHQEERKKESTLRDAGASQTPKDARQQLWQDGLPIVQRLTGKPRSSAASLLGKMLRSLKDDCAACYQILIDAEDARPVDPIPWLVAAAEDRKRRRSKITGILASMGLSDDGCDPLDLFA